MPWTRSPPLLAKLAYAATGTVQLPPMRRTNARSASRAALVGQWSMAPYHLQQREVVAPRLYGQRTLARVRDEGLGREELVGLGDAP